MNVSELQIFEDGVTHINAYSQSQCTLGRLLSNFAHTPFVCEDGRFESIEGYWYWLLARDHNDRDQLRLLYGSNAKKVGRGLSNEVHFADKDDKFIGSIKAALRNKIKANQYLSDLLRDSVVPIVHYYTQGDRVRPTVGGEWVWTELEQIRSGLKNPFFNF